MAGKLSATIGILVALGAPGAAGQSCAASTWVTEGTCQNRVQTLEACTAAAARYPSIVVTPAATRQSEGDRPSGCWVQVHTTPQLATVWFNTPLAGSTGENCSQYRQCLCCATATSAGSSPTLLTATQDCDPYLRSSGRPFDAECAAPVATREQCTQVMAGIPGGAVEQATDDRPQGCWYQKPGSGSSESLWFNQPPASGNTSALPGCEEARQCVCCTTTVTTTRLCNLQILTSGTCPTPAQSLEECTSVARQDQRVRSKGLTAQQQNEEDRPRGCWWQPGDSIPGGSEAFLFYNEPPAQTSGGNHDYTCSDARRCMCCHTGTTVTTTWAGVCVPQLVGLGAPYDASSCPRPYSSTSECEAATAQHPELNGLTAAVQSHDASDRPYGCWYQRAQQGHMAAVVFFNSATEDVAQPQPCTEERPCLCCGENGQTIPDYGPCYPGFLESGLVSNSAECLRPVQSAQECKDMASALGLPAQVTLQSEAGRPEGCWFQDNNGQTVFFNTPPSSASADTQECSVDRKCMCCMHTTTTTTATTTSTTFFESSTATTVTSTTATATTTLPALLSAGGEADSQIASNSIIGIAFVIGTILVIGVALLTAFLRSRMHQEEAKYAPEVLPDHRAVIPKGLSALGKSARARAAASPRDAATPRTTVTPTSSPSGRSVPGCASPASRGSPISPASPSSRHALVQAAFERLDTQNVSALRCAELFNFATFMGFDGTEAEWKQEYMTICDHLDCDPATGLDFDAFDHLVNDTSVDGAFCSNADLRLLEEHAALLLAAPAGTTRTSPSREVQPCADDGEPDFSL